MPFDQPPNEPPKPQKPEGPPFYCQVCRRELSCRKYTPPELTGLAIREPFAFTQLAIRHWHPGLSVEAYGCSTCASSSYDWVVWAFFGRAIWNIPLMEDCTYRDFHPKILPRLRDTHRFLMEVAAIMNTGLPLADEMIALHNLVEDTTDLFVSKGHGGKANNPELDAKWEQQIKLAKLLQAATRKANAPDPD